MRLLLLLVACNLDFDPASHITGLRVLAIKAEPPELAPGQTATLTPLIFNGNKAPVTYQWSYCLQPPLPGSSVALQCVNSDLGPSFNTPLGNDTSAQVTMPNVRSSDLGIPDDTGGVYLPVLLTVSNGTESITAVYRLRYTTTIMSPIFNGPLQPPNHNPHIEDVLIAYERDAGTRPLGDLELHTGDRVMLRAQLPDSDHEKYPRIEGSLNNVSLDAGIDFFDGGVNAGGIQLVDVFETLRVSWFAGVGRLDPDVTGADGKLDTTLYLDKYLVPPPADIDLYVVVRDERGGVDFAQRKILLR